MSQIIKKNSKTEIHDIGKMGLDLSMVESQTFQDQAEAFNFLPKSKGKLFWKVCIRDK